jgi:hypothetical protein
MWTKLLDQREYQVGLQMISQESDPWGLSVTHSNAHLGNRATAISVAA